ncbi:MAG: mechanosensitive ion channel family protein [Candidatus Poseidoniales archaeon]|tara:strand:- start:938 stop:2047 length:1110 start_codon:yes stop_codon:yes gene_type:complete
MLDYESATESAFWMDEILGFNNLTLALLLGVVVIALLTRFFTMWLAPKLLKKIITSDSIENKAVKDSDKALGNAAGAGISFFIFAGIADASSVAESSIMMPQILIDLVPGALQLIISISLIMWAFRLVEIVQDVVEILDDDEELDGTEKTLISAIQSVLRFVIIFVGGVAIADSFGFNLTSLIAGLGISGIALALAAKDTISNFFGATTVLLDKPFRVGDWVVVGSSEGEVIQINLRTTLIRTSLDTVITMPNANLVNSPVENYGLRRWRRWQTQLHMDINSDPAAVDKFCNAVMMFISENEFTTKEDSSWCRVNMISPTSIDLAVNMYWNVSGSVQERQEREKLILEIMRLAKKNSLQFYDGRVRQQR